MTISSDGSAISTVAFGQIALEGDFAPDALTNACANQLMEYFSGKRMVFDISVRPDGSDFELSVWESLASIPYGQTRTPKEFAVLMGIPTSYRLVGKAAYANPVPVIIPSHRLVAASGREPERTRDSELRQACRELERRFM